MYKNENGIWLPDNVTVFVKPSERVIAQRKLEGLKKLAELKAWGLRNPVKWMSTMFGIELLDSQLFETELEMANLVTCLHSVIMTIPGIGFVNG